jgi:protein-L-isoaspartate O-methyltransferase
MDARAAFLGPALSAALADIPMRHVLEIAGGSGAYACALVDRSPQLRATVFERAPVDSAARALLAERGYSDRIEVASGDMFTDPLPAHHDEQRRPGTETFDHQRPGIRRLVCAW